MLPLILTLVLAAPLAGDVVPTLMVLKEAREDVVLPTRRVKLSHDVFDGTVTLRSKSAGKIMRQLLKSPSTLCPTIDGNATMVVLHCATRRVIPQLVKVRGKTVLRLERLRGVPTHGPAALPRISYAGGPKWLVLQGSCPGTRPIVAAECHYKAGKSVFAARLYRAELHGEHHALAALRLGDIARQSGRIELALGWYRQAGKKGPFARIAMARECSLGGSCFDNARDARAFSPLNSEALPAAIRDEVILSAALVYLFDDRPREAARHLLEEGMATPTSNPCRLAPTLCSKIAREALRMSQIDPDPVALAFYYALPGRSRNDDAFELAQIASDVADALGATGASAHLLAAVTSQVEKRALAKHLAKTAQRYLDAGDLARARAVVAFADEVDPKGVASRATLRRKSKRRPNEPTVPLDDNVPLPEVVRAGGVLFAAARALAPDPAEEPPKPPADVAQASADATRAAAVAEPRELAALAAAREPR